MRLAIEEARKGFGFVAPNPAVGCVIVDNEGCLLAVGHHARVGGDHAEIAALKNVNDSRTLEGATFFVTLEPCAHEGRTPSCAKALARLPIARVVYGLRDPNPLVAGQGAEILRAAGIEALEFGESADVSPEIVRQMIDDLEDVAEIFLRNMRTREPFVAIKVATSLDGMMAMDSGESKWITGEEARLFSHVLRSRYDAVLIGRNTFEKDDPMLNVRLPGFEGQRNRAIVLDPSGATLGKMNESRILQARAADDVWVVVAKGTRTENPAGVRIVEGEADEAGELSIRGLLHALWANGVTSVFVEGGARTIGRFLESGHAHRLHHFTAPILLGGRHGLSWTHDFGGSRIADALTLRRVQRQVVGQDQYLTARLDLSAQS